MQAEENTSSLINRQDMQVCVYVHHLFGQEFSLINFYRSDAYCHTLPESHCTLTPTATQCTQLNCVRRNNNNKLQLCMLAVH